MATEVLQPEAGIKEGEQDILRGFVSEARIWQDTPSFKYSSSAGFYSPVSEDHMNSILITFSQDLVGPRRKIRHIRQRADGRYSTSIVIVEQEDIQEGSHERQDIEAFSIDKRQELQTMFNDFLVPLNVSRIFRLSHTNGSIPQGKIEYVGFEFRQKDTDPTDVNLVVGRNKEAFGIVYENFRERIEKYVRGILFQAGYNDNRWLSAEDIAQETFIKAYGARNRFVKYANIPVTSWLFKIASNLTIDHFKRGDFNQIAEIPVDSFPHAPKSAMNENLLLELQVVGQLMDGLPTKQQQTLAISSLGYGDAETAWLLNLPSVNDLKVLRHRGRVRLREMRLSPEERQLSQFYLLTLAHRLLISKVHRGKSYWEEGQLKTSVLQSLKGSGFKEYQVKSALAKLTEDFFDRLANIHIVPRDK